MLAAGLPWRDVALIRTISRFLRQVRVPYSQDYMWATLRKHAELAAEIVALFHMRFDPRLELSLDERGRREAEIRTRIDTALTAVESLDEDRILRCFVNAVEAAIRTNFYQVDASGQPKAAIAIKFASRNVEGMPVPRPLYEIFVYAPRVEGVHLRFGKVARGGVRWSDRPQDFRTEVLGLVKAQQVKNAVIVPVGVERRVRAEATAGRRLARGDPDRRRRRLYDLRVEPARRHRQYRSGQRDRRPPPWCAATSTIPIWWSRPTRARRRSPISPTASRPSTASGSTMPSRPAARPATTTRRWASRRAAPGRRSSAISASSTSTS